MKIRIQFHFFILALMISSSSSGSSTSDSLQLSIQALNLSEDMSTLSSKNDEILVLVYPFVDTTKLPPPLLAEYFVLDSATRKKIVTFQGAFSETPLLLFLAELDSDRSPDQVEKLFRKHFKEIIDCINKKDLIALQKYINDDDLIGFKAIETEELLKAVAFSFQGRYKLDKFHYRIEIKNFQK